MKKSFRILAAVCAFVLLLGVCVCAEESATVTVKGIGENVTVTLTMENGSIRTVEASSDNTEADDRGRESLQSVADAMVEKNSVNVDAVSGATGTSNAVIAAATEAWLQIMAMEAEGEDWMETEASADDAEGTEETEETNETAEAEETEEPAGGNGNAVPKVIFDTDMAYVNDDAIAMFMLAQADQAGMLELLGVTTAGGNVFVPEATTAALRQLELIDRTDIPVYQGTDEPLQGYRDMKEESRLYGVPSYCGAYWDFGTNDFRDLTRRSPDYLHLIEEPMHGYAETPAQEETAWDFILRAVHEYPGEVTIMTVGAATNVALALQKDPTLAEDAAGIIYMGGDIDCPGNATPAAEMNWYYDPEAIRQCLAADWKSQLVVPDDLAHQIHLTPEIYERLAAANQNLITKLILENKRTFDLGEADYVWDVVVPAVFLKPSLVQRTEERYITVDPTPGINSGRAVSWPQHRLNNIETGEGFPEGVNKADIVFAIDEEAFWDFYVDLLSR